MLFGSLPTCCSSPRSAEKSTDYSLSNTVRSLLFLPCTREEKYSAKQAIDSFFFRMGDVVSATIVFFGTQAGLRASGFAKLNVVLAAASPGTSPAPAPAR